MESNKGARVAEGLTSSTTSAIVSTLSLRCDYKHPNFKGRIPTQKKDPVLLCETNVC